MAGALGSVAILAATVAEMCFSKVDVSFAVKADKALVCQIFFSDDSAAPYKFNTVVDIDDNTSVLNAKLRTRRLRRLRIDFGSYPGKVVAGAPTLIVNDTQRRLDWHDFSPNKDIDAISIGPDGTAEISSSRRDPYLVYSKPIDISTPSQAALHAHTVVCFVFTAIFAWLLFSCAPNLSMLCAAEKMFLFIIVVQVSLAAAWMLFNLGVPTSFGDTKDYLGLSRTFAVDEYRPVGYPVVIACSTWLEAHTRLPHEFFIYMLQLLVAILCVSYAVRTLDRLFLGGFLSRSWHPRMLLFASLYLATFPLVGMMNFAAMSDSLALSATLVFLTATLSAIHGEGAGWKDYALVFAAFFGGSMMRGDRPYLFLTFGLAMALAYLLRMRKSRKAALCLAATILAAFATVMAVNRLTQKSGRYERPRTTFEFILLDRIVWPHMTECYNLFPASVREVVTLDDAKNFDANNNNVMYKFAKKMNGLIGEQRAHELYRTMAETVFRARTKRVVYEIAHDVAKAFLSPFFQVAEVYNIDCHRNSPCINPFCYNPRCFMQATKPLTWALNAIPLHLFAFAFAFFLVKAIFRRRLGAAARRAAPALWAYFGFSALLALFYCLGDGAHPNSRYLIIIDSSWVVALLVLFSAQGSASLDNNVTVQNTNDNANE